jgi:hypothetical protein
MLWKSDKNPKSFCLNVIRLDFVFRSAANNNMGVFQSSTPLTEFDRESMSTQGGVKYEGYWANSEDEKSNFPFPVGSDTAWPGKDEFLTKLRKKQSSAEETSYRGMSHCRLVGKHNCQSDSGFDDQPVKDNGSSEFSITSPNGDLITWPEGYAHYVEVHNVKPSREFYNFIMN